MRKTILHQFGATRSKEPEVVAGPATTARGPRALPIQWNRSGRFNDEQVGQWSDVASISVMG